MGKSTLVVLTMVSLIIMLFIPTTCSTIFDHRTWEKHPGDIISSQQNLVETEVLFVPNIPFQQMPSIDLMVGNGMVHGLFLASNGLLTTTVVIAFFKWVPPGWLAFDLVCTHINVKLVDWTGAIVDTYQFTDPSGFLFSNDWYGMATLYRPPLAVGLFFFVFIEIYGNYE
jgi:hypothetical protein